MVIQQAFGLGDVIFTQSIANDFIKDGFKVLWPVLPHLVEGLNFAYHKVVFVDHTKFNIDYNNKQYAIIDGMVHLPMRYSESLIGLPYKYHMKSKYDFLGKDWRAWKESAMYKRNRIREISLCTHLGLNDGKEYNLISMNFGNAGKAVAIDVKNDLKNIELTPVEGYSLFDWSRVIENATNIHAVSSSSLYLFELLNLKAKDVHMYPRLPAEQNFDFVDFLFTKNYILHV